MIDFIGRGSRELRVDGGSDPWTAALPPHLETLARRLEERARTQPARYRREVALAAALGIAVVLLVLAVVIGLAVAIGLVIYESGRLNALGVKLVLVLGLVAFSILAALRVKIAPLAGRALSADDAPALFAAIERVRQATGGPAIDRVLIHDDMNASIQQLPRFGPIGPHRNYLAIGLPLMQALTVAEFEAVLAHEFGHLAGAHGKFGARIYQARQIWAQLADNLGTGLTARMLGRFFRWYGPWFAAYSFALARAEENEADRLAAKVAGSRVAADALQRIAAAAAANSALWRAVWAESDRMPEPALWPLRGGPAFYAARSDSEVRAAVAAELAYVPGYDDTHPSLAARLATLGEDVRPLGPVVESAATRLLGDAEAALAAELDAEWWASAQEHWAECFEAGEAERARLAELEAADPDEDDEAAAVTRAWLTEHWRSPEAAIPLYARHAERWPDVPDSTIAIGRLQLAAGDPAGLERIEAGLARAPQLTLSIADFVVDELRKLGREEEAEQWRRRGAEAAEHARLAQQERAAMRDDDRFEPPVLPPEDLAELRAALDGLPGLRRAWLARRCLRYSDAPHHVLLVERRWFHAASTLLDAAVVAAGDRDILIVNKLWSTAWVARAVRAAAPEPLYRR